MTGKARQSLTEFAKENGGHHGTGPWFKTLPQDVHDEAVAGWKSGIGGSAILQWLHSIGYAEATRGRVFNYLREIPRG